MSGAGDAPGRGPGRRHGAGVGVRRERRALLGALDDGRSGSACTAPRPGASPSGVHGTGLEKVVVQPAGTQLSTDTETTIKASTDLAFDVSVKNSGENQEVSVEVTLTIPKGTTPIVKKQTIDLLDIGRDQDGHVQGLPRSSRSARRRPFR